MVAHSNRKPCCHRYKRAHFLGALTWAIKSWVARHWITQHPMTTVHTRTSQSTYTCTPLSLPQLPDPFHVGLTVTLESGRGIFWGRALVFATELNPRFLRLLSVSSSPQPNSLLLARAIEVSTIILMSIKSLLSFLSLFLEKPHCTPAMSTSRFPWRPKFNLSNTLKLIKCCFTKSILAWNIQINCSNYSKYNLLPRQYQLLYSDIP